MNVTSDPIAHPNSIHGQSPEVARLTEARNHGQQDWMAGLTAADLVSVDHTRHDIELDQRDVVIDDISRRLP
jgi:hypothetical protein